MEKSKTGIYWILGIVLIVMAFIYFYRDQLKALFTTTNKSVEADNSDNSAIITDAAKTYKPATGLPVDLAYKIANIYSYTENEQLAIWVEMFKTCTYWKAFVLDTYNRYKSNKQNKGVTLATRYYVVANEMMDGMADIKEKYLRCGNPYTRAKGNAEYNSIGLKSM